MNTKIERVTREIEKTRARISDDSARLKDLERQKIELENTEIVALFRSVDVAPDKLAAFISQYKSQGDAVSAIPMNNPPAESHPFAGNNLEEDTDE